MYVTFNEQTNAETGAMKTVNYKGYKTKLNRMMNSKRVNSTI